MAPGYAYPGVPAYLCGHNILKAHAVTVELFRRSGFRGKIGITLDSFWFEAKTASASDAKAVEQALQFYVSGQGVHLERNEEVIFCFPFPVGLVRPPDFLLGGQLPARDDQPD